MISPLLWEDEHFGALSAGAKILFIACISNADDDGRLSANPSNLRAIAFRFEDLSLKAVISLRKEISEKMGNFKVYNVNGCDYIQLTTWEEYQTIQKDRYKPSTIPAWNQDVSTLETDCIQNGNIKGKEVKGKEVKLKEVKLKEEKGSGIPPSFDDVKTYCEERKNSINPKRFLDYYSSNGWKVGKNPMKDWRAAVRTWESKGAFYGENKRVNKFSNESNRGEILEGLGERVG